MEVPPRPQPPALLLPLDRPLMPELLQDHIYEDLFSPEDDDFFGESDSELQDGTTSLLNMSICSQDSFIELKEESEEAQRRSEEDKLQEMKAQRQKLAVQELLESERNYLRMLRLSYGTIQENLLRIQPPLVNVDSIFELLPAVISVTSHLLNSVDDGALQPGDPLFLQSFCDSFLALSSHIESAYREYLSCYSQVTQWEVSTKQKEALWDQVVRVLQSAAPELKASSLSFFLVMPVQRIARYPLLLQTIKSHTEPSHPAFGLLEETARTSVDINCRINEYKRIREFREVADKYKKTESLSIKDMINRLNTHSIFKKTARLSQQIKHETGIAPKLVDEEFDSLEGFFYLLEKCILELLENVETYLTHLQVFLSCKTEEFDLYLDGQREPICYKEITTALRQWILPTFEKRLRSLIHKPLCALRDLLVGPRNLIRKRLDKLLDYELIEAKSSLSYEEQAAANTYKTMNTLLLTELPRFNTVSLQLIWRLLGTFSCLHRDLASDMTQLFQTFATQLPHSALSPSAFWEWAEAAVMHGMKNLQRLCQTVEEALSAPVATVTRAPLLGSAVPAAVSEAPEGASLRGHGRSGGTRRARPEPHQGRAGGSGQRERQPGRPPPLAGRRWRETRLRSCLQTEAIPGAPSRGPSSSISAVPQTRLQTGREAAVQEPGPAPLLCVPHLPLPSQSQSQGPHQTSGSSSVSGGAQLSGGGSLPLHRPGSEGGLSGGRRTSESPGAPRQEGQPRVELSPDGERPERVRALKLPHHGAPDQLRKTLPLRKTRPLRKTLTLEEDQVPEENSTLMENQALEEEPNP